MTILANGAAPDLRERVLARTIHPGTTTHGGTEEELAWLRARQGRVTATMAKELVRGGPGVRRRLIEESFEPPVPITGNRYIDRGHEREPAIARWIERRFGILPNTALVGSEQNERHASTPDGIGDAVVPSAFGFDASTVLVLAEIKTSKHDLDPDRAYFGGTGYLEQMQWQMHTTGALRTLFVWEQHDDAWPNPQPLDLEPRFAWVDRDDALISRMIAAADLFLAERDRVVAEKEATGEPLSTTDPEVEGLALAVLSAREESKAAEARLKAPWNRLLGLLANREGFSTSTGLAQVTWRNDVTTKQVPDEDAALAAEIELAEGGTIHGADLAAHVVECEAALAASDAAANLAAARSAWAAHLAGFTRTQETSKQRLDVNPPKKATR